MGPNTVAEFIRLRLTLALPDFRAGILGAGSFLIRCSNSAFNTAPRSIMEAIRKNDIKRMTTAPIEL